jgi:hypothetical protein
MIRFLLCCIVLIPMSAQADDQPISLVERFLPGTEYRVNTNVELQGELMIPVEEGKPPQKVEMHGISSIEYDEKILPIEAKMGDQKSLRIYKKIDFSRMIGDQKQGITLRPEVRRLVIIRKDQAKIPFSPDGPLTWGEIDLLRTDIFLPLIAGVLPGDPVKPGDTWKVSLPATLELTDMEKVTDGELTCKFEETIVLNGRKAAHITLGGELRGVNEDGPIKQKVRGKLYFDLTHNYIGYLSINGEHILLDKDGKQAGKIKGEYILVRQLNPRNPSLAHEAVTKTNVTPNGDNTLLLYDNEQLGVRFSYPRSWHVVRVQNNRITLDEKNGNGMLITLEPAEKVPTTKDFLKETQGFLKKLDAKIAHATEPSRLEQSPREVDRFTISGEIGGQRVAMDYLIARQTGGGAIFAARLFEADKSALMKDVEKIARSFQLTKPIGARK